MFKVFIDEDTIDNDGKPHYIMVELETGKCCYLGTANTAEEEEEFWKTDQHVYPSIYCLFRHMRDCNTKIIVGPVLGEFETISEALNMCKTNDLLE